MCWALQFKNVELNFYFTVTNVVVRLQSLYNLPMDDCNAKLKDKRII